MEQISFKFNVPSCLSLRISFLNYLEQILLMQPD
jgi:hypothetical protein